MAKYIWVDSKGMFTYALDECEDYLVLNAYLRLRESGKFENDRPLKVFEYYHLQEGGTLNDNIIMQLNGNLRRLGRSHIRFVNGHTTNYAAMRGQDKTKRRWEIINQLEALTDEQREALIAKKENEAERLAERNPDISLPPPPQAVSGGLQRAELERRRAALAAAQKIEAASSQKSIAGANNKENPIDDSEQDLGPESTVQDNVVALISEMGELRREVADSRQELAAVKAMLQTIFNIPTPRKRATKTKPSK